MNEPLIASRAEYDAFKAVAVIDPCPWCGKQPVIATRRAGHRDEPYTWGGLGCPNKCCERHMVLSDGPAGFDTAFNTISHEVPDIGYQFQYAAIYMRRLVAHWNWKTR